jgi:predicted PurR-regulated permease PerM
MSTVSWLSSGALRLYAQFIVILLIALAISFIINPIFGMDDDNSRIMSSALFLAGFVALMAVLSRS